jgi:hypothetical protein
MLEDGKLSGNAVKRFQSALLSGFPDRNALARMVRQELEQSLDAISAPLNLTATVFELIKWAEAQGRIPDLVQGACTANPGNPELQAFAAAYASTAGPAMARSPAPMAPSTSQPSGGSPAGPLVHQINMLRARLGCLFGLAVLAACGASWRPIPTVEARPGALHQGFVRVPERPWTQCDDDAQCIVVTLGGGPSCVDQRGTAAVRREFGRTMRLRYGASDEEVLSAEVSLVMCAPLEAACVSERCTLVESVR